MWHFARANCVLFVLFVSRVTFFFFFSFVFVCLSQSLTQNMTQTNKLNNKTLFVAKFAIQFNCNSHFNSFDWQNKKENLKCFDLFFTWKLFVVIFDIQLKTMHLSFELSSFPCFQVSLLMSCLFVCLLLLYNKQKQSLSWIKSMITN